MGNEHRLTGNSEKSVECSKMNLCLVTEQVCQDVCEAISQTEEILARIVGASPEKCNTAPVAPPGSLLAKLVMIREATLLLNSRLKTLESAV